LPQKLEGALRGCADYGSTGELRKLYGEHIYAASSAAYEDGDRRSIAARAAAAVRPGTGRVLAT